MANHYGIRTDRYTLAYFDATDEWELFDNKKDPHQLRSVYNSPAYAKTLVALKAEMRRLRVLYQDSS